MGILIIIVCYIGTTILWIVNVLYAIEVDENEQALDTTQQTLRADKQVGIVGVSKSKILEPLKETNKAQIPNEQLDKTFNTNPAMDIDIERDYQIEPQDIEFEKNEILSEPEQSVPFYDPYTFEQNIKIEAHTCIDFYQIETSSTRMVRGTATQQDARVLSQLEGTAIFNQLTLMITTTNLEKVRAILETN